MLSKVDALTVLRVCGNSGGGLVIGLWNLGSGKVEGEMERDMLRWLTLIHCFNRVYDILITSVN